MLPTGGDWDWRLIPFLVFVAFLTTVKIELIGCFLRYINRNKQPVLQVLAKVMIPTWSVTPLGFPSLFPVLFYIAGMRT